MLNKSLIARLVRDAFIKSYIDLHGIYYVPIAVSNRHVHLSEDDISKLFGENYTLTAERMLSQPEQYACKEIVTLVGPKGRIEGVKVLGPSREQTQVEISVTDSFSLGVKPIIRMSGDLQGTPKINVIGPKGQVQLTEGLIVAARHLHISEEEAKWFGLKDRDVVRIKKKGVREITFSEVVARVGKKHSLEVHIDRDEANAAGIMNGELVLLEKV